MAAQIAVKGTLSNNVMYVNNTSIEHGCSSNYREEYQHQQESEHEQQEGD